MIFFGSFLVSRQEMNVFIKRKPLAIVTKDNEKISRVSSERVQRIEKERDKGRLKMKEIYPC